MDKSKLIDFLAPELETMGFEIVELEISGSKGKPLLRLYVDKGEEISDRCTMSLEDCAKVSRTVERLLDVENFFSNTYVLEVSTPGVERPLKSLKDFDRFKERLSRVTLIEAVDGETFFEGKISERQDSIINFEVNGKQKKIAFTNIKRAKLTFER